MTNGLRRKEIKDNSRLYVIIFMLVAVVAVWLYGSHDRYQRHYESARDYFETKKIDNYKIIKYMDAIDLDKPLFVYEIKTGTILAQYQVPGAPQGCFYVKEDIECGNMGVSCEGFDKRSKKVVSKVKYLYKVVKSTLVLKSIAGDTIDTWSIPGKEIKVNGGEEQYFSNCKSCFELIK